MLKMASSPALKRLLCPKRIPTAFFRSIRPVAGAPSLSQFFNTNAVRNFADDDNNDLDFDPSGFSKFPSRGDYLSGSATDRDPYAFDPFSPTRSLSQVLNLKDQMAEYPTLSASRGVGAGVRRGWDAKETEYALTLRIDMPGLGKEEVKVSVEQNSLVIKGEGESGRKYGSRIELAEKIFKMGEIKAEMKNGVLKVVVPKVKEEERTDVFQITVE